MSNDFCELDLEQLAHVTGGGGLLARFLSKRPLLRALLQELIGGGKGEGGEGGAGGETAQSAASAATGGQSPAGGQRRGAAPSGG